MGFFKKRFRSITVLLIIILLCITVATATYRGSDFISNSKSSVIDFFSPLQERVFMLFMPVLGLVDSIRDYANLREKYNSLEEEVRDLRQGYIENTNLRIENRALREMLDIKVREEFNTQPARVIGYYQSKWQSEIIINTGKMDGVDIGMGVVNQDGLIGTVIFSSDSTSNVSLLNNPGSSIGARVLSSRILGIAEGSEEKKILLNYIPANETVFIGDIILTSELSKYIPPDILIGRVKSVAQEAGNAYKHIEIEPFADFKSLEYVMVIKNK
jgi:rod shape-determining protein MreC